ncbi:MAG: hypothetical protein K2V38_14815, partial [Gemmataceae bacterium]|nr:hypothetical protein [Gemmataceae bacterium]
IAPVQVTEGGLTYRVAYEADFGPPPTVRPVQPLTKGTDKGARAPAVPLITLEFDATRPGHPLVRVHIPQPLS